MESTRIVRRAALKPLTGLSMSSLYRLMAKGAFPRPLQLSSQAVGWDINDIEIWLQARRGAVA